MKHDKLFSTHVYLFDNVIDNNSLLQIRKDITSSYNQTTKNWQSKANLHRNKLYDKLTNKVVENTKKVFDSLHFEYQGFNITDMWSNVLKPGETHRPHTHSNNILSGVFYVDAEQTSGIMFTDPRPQAGVIQPDVTKQFVDNANVIKYDSSTNRMILFPSWLQHYVPRNRNTDRRISISFNLMLKGMVGEKGNLQSAKF